jgi:hypothetical protein
MAPPRVAVKRPRAAKKAGATVKKAPARAVPAPKFPEVPEEYKGLVRGVAMRAIRDNGWCRSGANKELESLGLDPIPEGRQVTVSFEMIVRTQPGTRAPSDVHVKTLMVRACRKLVGVVDIDGEEVEVLCEVTTQNDLGWLQTV